MIHFTKHAIARYNERVRANHATEPEADIDKLLEIGHMRHKRPAWIKPGNADDAFFMVGKSIAFILAAKPNGDYVATTCVARGNCDRSHEAVAA